MPSLDFEQRIDQVLELAGLDPHTGASARLRELLESISCMPPPPADDEFARLLEQISDGQRSQWRR
ncbi:hypothetical protein JM946_18545 [Steroidobacter sp. S1-65]|uniref:Uncharacterized protein n=1 Tax=Steroidobacter gossypii TaxID=2805490 RepID=A0ABS1X0J1_9GAMM|nr:hypothetical protein [Steroidobacter gossypii]MBM0106736.1 hypothetical protein [Steroidobacter gossypii]